MITKTLTALALASAAFMSTALVVFAFDGAPGKVKGVGMANDLEGHVIFKIAAVLFGIYLCWTLASGKTRYLGSTYTRENDPVIYWAVTIALAIATGFAVRFALSAFF